MHHAYHGPLLLSDETVTKGPAVNIHDYSDYFPTDDLSISARKAIWVPLSWGVGEHASLSPSAALAPDLSFLGWSYIEALGFCPQYHTFLIICVTSWISLKSALDYLLKVADKQIELWFPVILLFFPDACVNAL